MAKTKDGGILLYTPHQLESKEKPNLNLGDLAKREPIWVKLKLPHIASYVNKVLLIVSYNPHKSFSCVFNDNLSKSIEVAMLEQLTLF